MKLNLLNLNFGRAMVALTQPRTKRRRPQCSLRSRRCGAHCSVLACMLRESEFYESGETIATRTRELVPRVPPETVAL